MPALHPSNPDWLTLADRARELAHLVEMPNIDTLAVAKAFTAMAAALLGATLSGGQTSLRFEAVVKAFDLATPKSALLAFLGRGSP